MRSAPTLQAGRCGLGGALEPPLGPRGAEPRRRDSSPSRPPPSSQLLLGHQLPLQLPLPDPPPRSGAHPRAPLPPSSLAARPEQQSRGAAPRQPASLQPLQTPPRAMNLFRFLGDLSHLLAIILLLLKIWKSRSCAGETPTGAEEGGGAGHIQDSGFGGTREMSPSPYRLLGIPHPGPGSPGGQFPSPDCGCIQFCGGGLQVPNSASPGPSLAAPGCSGSSRERWQAGRWLGIGDVDRGGQEESGREATGSGGAEVE